MPYTPSYLEDKLRKDLDAEHVVRKIWIIWSYINHNVLQGYTRIPLGEWPGDFIQNVTGKKCLLMWHVE